MNNNFENFNNENINTGVNNVSNGINGNFDNSEVSNLNKSTNTSNNKNNNDKKVLVLIICIILIILALVSILIASLSSGKKDDKVTTTTTTTEKVVEEKVLSDELTNISVKVDDTKYFDNKLSIKKVEDVKIENIDDKTLLMVYDIDLLDENNNIVKAENANLLISIPYNNENNYTEFKVLHLDENNKVVETLNASYQNGKVVFEVNHLSRFAIVGTKVEEQTTTTTTQKPTTQAPTTTKKPTTQAPATTKKPTTEAPATTKPTSKPTTKPTTQPTTKPTTKPVAKTYTVGITGVDEYSPSVTLHVYENGAEITSSVKSISYENGTYLCSGQNATVMRKVVTGQSRFIIELSDGTKVTASVR